MKSAVFASLVLIAGAGVLVSCGQGTSAGDAAVEKPTAGLAASNARLYLAPVKGNPAAVYFDLANGSAKDWMISKAALAGASSTMLHTVGGAGNDGGMGMVAQVPLKKGETARFEPGKLHVMVMDPPADLTPGAITTLTLRFAGGDEFSFPVEVKAAGEER